ncbi:MAG TPA: glutaredoxin domain-containing protein [Polyangiaceae bacterium]|nr:glutaredoxin domain-containing protein [Polyangiaceae bacterium]
MLRPILEVQRIHPAIHDKLASQGGAILDEVEAAIASHDVVVVGMRQNPFPRRARKLLDQQGIRYRYLEYGSYLSQWRERLKLKLWTGWPTFPMIFVKGVLIGGFQDLQRLVQSGDLSKLLAAPRSQS